MLIMSVVMDLDAVPPPPHVNACTTPSLFRSFNDKTDALAFPISIHCNIEHWTLNTESQQNNSSFPGIAMTPRPRKRKPDRCPTISNMY